MRGQPGHNTGPHAKLPPSSLSMYAWTTSQLNVPLIYELRGPLMYFFLRVRFLFLREAQTCKKETAWTMIWNEYETLQSNLSLFRRQTIKNKKWRFSVVTPVYRGFEPLLAPAWDWTTDPIPPSTLAGNLATVPQSLVPLMYLAYLVRCCLWVCVQLGTGRRQSTGAGIKWLHSTYHLLIFYLCVRAQLGTGRRPVDWCKKINDCTVHVRTGIFWTWPVLNQGPLVFSVVLQTFPPSTPLCNRSPVHAGHLWSMRFLSGPLP